MSVGHTTVAMKLRVGAVLAGVVVGAAACGSGGGTASPPPSRPPSSAGSQVPTTNPPPTLPPSHGTTGAPTSTGQARGCVDRIMAGMTDRQRVGQLIMAGVSASGVSRSQLDILRRDHVGSVILMGHTDAGTRAVRGVSDRVQSVAPSIGGARVGMLVSTDQEGGQVQVLNGPGFSSIPSAVTQGQWPTGRLQSAAADWGGQLRAAGVTVDLAPVVDVVPPSLTSVNEPIGKLMREYGNDPQTVARQSSAVVRGLGQAGVLSTLKHFPTLGQVRGNTDFSANVTDDGTPRDGSNLIPYRSGIAAGAQFVLASLATYPRIDPGHQAAFSSVLLRDVLRGTLGFRGVVISDDLGKAVAVRATPPGERAVDFLSAGGDMVLTVESSTVDAMTNAILAKLPKDAKFRSDVGASVHRVLNAKVNAGVLSCGR